MRILYEVRLYHTPDLQGEALIHWVNARDAGAALRMALAAEGQDSLPEGWSATAKNPQTGHGGEWTRDYHCVVRTTD